MNRVGKRCVLLALESHYALPLAHHWVPESKVSPISISPENKLPPLPPAGLDYLDGPNVIKKVLIRGRWKESEKAL